MAKIYYDNDVNPAALEGKTIAILGYGSQGHAHALNLHDNGFNVVVGLEEWDKGREKATEKGLRVVTIAEAAKLGDVVMMLVPDQYQREVYEKSVAANLVAGNMLMFAHGFNIHFNQITPPADVDVTMIAPKAPGHRMRELFEGGMGVPGLVAVFQDATGKAKEKALAYGRGIGCTRAGVLETTFGEETETDLFGEQCVLCGGVTALIKTGFETLVEAGYQPEIAYFECLHEVKLIVDLIYEGGMSYMRYSVSDTAEYGDYTRGPMVVDELTRETMRDILKAIQNGEFAREWILENQAGRPSFLALRRQNQEHIIEKTGEQLRSMMPWLKSGKKSPTA